MLGVAYSFGTNVAKETFIDMGTQHEFDEDKAEGVFNLFLAIGTTLSSVLFGMMIDQNNNLNVWMFVGVAASLMVIYKLFFRQRSKK